MSKTALFQTTQFSVSALFSSIKSIDMTLSGATTPGPRVYLGAIVILRIAQSSCIIGASQSDCLVSYPGHTLGRCFTLCRDVSVFCSPNRLGQWPFKDSSEVRASSEDCKSQVTKILEIQNRFLTFNQLAQSR